MKDTEQILKKVTLQIMEQHNLVDYDLTITPTTSNCSNFTSAVYNITLTKGDDVIDMCGKVAIFGEQLRTVWTKIYKNEYLVYSKLLHLYDRLHEKHGVPQKNRDTFPKFYGSNLKKYEETIVMENLAVRGYQNYSRFASIDWEYGKAALNAFAEMHALGFALSEYMPEEFNQFIEDFDFKFDARSKAMMDVRSSLVNRAVKTVQEEHKTKLQKFFENESNYNSVNYCEAGSNRRTTLIHRDSRTANLMHKIRDDGTVDIKILDLQTIQGGSPVVDLLILIFTASDEEFRAQYYDKLIDHYYTELAAAMKRLHLDPEKVYSREDFYFELKEKLPIGLTIAVFTLPIVTVDTEDAPVVNEDLDLSMFSVEKANDLYTQRLNGVVNDYVKWGILK